MIEYSKVRDEMRVGDAIGCRGEGMVSKVIRKLKGGEHDFSHVAIIIRDTFNEATGRVEVLEALGKHGMDRNYLSEFYKKEHGALFWIPMCCDYDQRAKIMEESAKILEKKVKYDFKSTWFAAFSNIFVDVKKFNCSEAVWYILTLAGRLVKKFDKKGREIAPVPGDLPAWAGVNPVELDMKN